MPTKRKMIHVYVTDDEKTIIEQKAAEHNLSVSKYLLAKGLGVSKSVLVAKPEIVDVELPPPPDDGVTRGFFVHPTKADSKTSKKI